MLSNEGVFLFDFCFPRNIGKARIKKRTRNEKEMAVMNGLGRLHLPISTNGRFHSTSNDFSRSLDRRIFMNHRRRSMLIQEDKIDDFSQWEREIYQYTFPTSGLINTFLVHFLSSVIEIQCCKRETTMNDFATSERNSRKSHSTYRHMESKLPTNEIRSTNETNRHSSCSWWETSREFFVRKKKQTHWYGTRSIKTSIHHSSYTKTFRRRRRRRRIRQSSNIQYERRSQSKFLFTFIHWSVMKREKPKESIDFNRTQYKTSPNSLTMKQRFQLNNRKENRIILNSNRSNKHFSNDTTKALNQFLAAIDSHIHGHTSFTSLWTIECIGHNVIARISMVRISEK